MNKLIRLLRMRVMSVSSVRMEARRSRDSIRRTVCCRQCYEHRQNDVLDAGL